MKNFYSKGLLPFFLLIILGLNPLLSSAQTYAPVPYSTGFESGTLDASWTIASSQSGLNIEIIQTGVLTWSGQTAYSHTGNYFLGMDYEIGGTYNLNTADLHLNTAGSSALRLQFWWAEWNDETETQDGIYVSDNGGVSFTKILDLNGAATTDLSWNYFDMSLDSVNTLYGLNYTSNYIVRFQQYDNYYFAGGNDGFLFDDISVATTCSPSSSSINPTICASYTVPSGDETYTSSGVYLDTIANSTGCDSVITIDLVILQPSFSSTSASVCDSFTSVGGITYTATGIYTETYTNAIGCDSIVSLDIEILQPSFSSSTISACDSYTSPGGTNYTASGMYTEMYSNAAGCDSTVTIDLTINSPSSSSISETVLDSYTAPSGTVYTASGTYTDVIPNAAGCDSVITINLVVNHTGIEEYNLEVIHVYPNPTNGPLYIDGLQNIVGIEFVKIYDTKGRVAAELDSDANEFSISASDSGVYFLVVQHVHGTSRIQLVKH